MNKKIRIIGALSIASIWVVLTFIMWFSPANKISDTERRKLQQMPKITIENVLNGDFVEKFEKYTTDQFPFRDEFRTLKAVFNQKVMRQSDNHDIYIAYGHAAKMEYPLDTQSVKYFIDRINYIQEKYLKDTNTHAYCTIVPDKGYYISENSHHLTMDYKRLFNSVKDSIDNTQYIDITNRMNKNSYYKTDTHWRQEKIVPIANHLLETMGSGNISENELTIQEVKKPFYGVYYGQAALPMKSETMYYYTSDIIDNASVFDFETQKELQVYDEDAVNKKDLYDNFLHGAKSLLKIENPNATTDKELILFRDSFGSSITPLLIKGYKSITMIDLRYIGSDLIEKYVEFDNQDVLFLYSTLVINNSKSLK